MLDKQEIEARNKCDRFMCKGVQLGVIDTIYGYFCGDEEIYQISYGITSIIKQETLSQCTGKRTLTGIMTFENDVAIDKDYTKFLIKNNEDGFYLKCLSGNQREFPIKDLGSTNRGYKLIGDLISKPALADGRNG